MHVFKTRTTTGRGHFACQGSGVFQIFIPSISNREKILVTQMRSCEDKLKGKTAHFRLPSASQKRACLSSLMFSLHRVGRLWKVLLLAPIRTPKKIGKLRGLQVDPGGCVDLPD